MQRRTFLQGLVAMVGGTMLPAKVVSAAATQFRVGFGEEKVQGKIITSLWPDRELAYTEVLACELKDVPEIRRIWSEIQRDLADAEERFRRVEEEVRKFEEETGLVMMPVKNINFEDVPRFGKVELRPTASGNNRYYVYTDERKEEHVVTMTGHKQREQQRILDLMSRT